MASDPGRGPGLRRLRLPRNLRGRLGLRGLGRAGNATALLVPVPEAEFLHHRRDAGRPPLGVPGLPLHVTVLYPFLDATSIDEPVERALAALAGSHPPFPYVLARVGRFPDAFYLAVEPPDRFVALTQAVQARWPSHPPHGGAFDEIRPHLTLAYGHEPPGLAAAIEPALPIGAVARELLLMVRAPDGNWVTRLRLPLGGTGDERIG